MGDARARLTPVDIVMLVASVAVLGMLAGPIFSILDQQAGVLGTGPAYLFRMAVPGMVATVLVVTYAIAVGGGGVR